MAYTKITEGMRESAKAYNLAHPKTDSLAAYKARTAAAVKRARDSGGTVTGHWR